MTQQAEVVIEPVNEVATLFGGNSDLDAEFSKMKQEDAYIESTSSNDEQVSNNDTNVNTDDKVITNADEQATNNKEVKTESADEEDYRPEEYKHNKNYKAAMEEERREKAEIKKHFNQIKEENEKLKQLFEKLASANKEQPQVEEKPIPSYEEDPIEHLRLRAEKAEKILSDIQNRDQKNQELTKQQQAVNQLLNVYQQKVNEFRSEAPDFNEAYKFAIEARVKEYEIFGYDKQTAVAMANEDEAAIVSRCLQQGVNPAQRIYEFAKTRGYAGKQAEQQQAKQANNIEKLSMIEKGLEASKSVGAGGHKPAELTLEAIAAMSDEELENFDWNKVLKLG